MALLQQAETAPPIPFGPFPLPHETREAGALFDKLLHGKLEGKVVAAIPLALPDDAELEIRLLDLSDIGAPVITIASEVISAPRRLPHGFSLPYDACAIRRGATYAISATIRVQGKLLFGNAHHHLVFTGSGQSDVKLRVQPVA